MRIHRLSLASMTVLAVVALLIVGTLFTDLGDDLAQRAIRSALTLTMDSPIQACSRLSGSDAQRRCLAKDCLYRDPQIDAERCRRP